MILVPRAAAESIGALKPLFRELSPRRRAQLKYVLALMVLGGAAEMLSLGAVLAFLTLVTGTTPPEDSVIAPLVRLLVGPEGGVPWRGVFFLVVVGAVSTGIRLLLAWVSQKYVLRVGHDLGVKLYSRILYQPYNAHLTRNTSDVIAAIEKIQLIIFGIILPVIQAVVACVIATFIVVSLFLIDPLTAAIAALAIAVPYGLSSLASIKALRATATHLAAMQTGRIRQVQEGLGGVRDIIIDRSQGVFVEEFRRMDDSYRRAQTVYNFVGGAPRFIVEFSGVLLIAGMALLLSAREGGLAAAIPMLGALALGAQRLLPLAQQIFFSWSSLLALHNVTTDVLDLLHSPVLSLSDDRANPSILPFRRDLVLDGVTFRYSGVEQPALHQVDLTIARGSTVGFIGETGSGKSTLLDVIMGLLEPTSGEIRIDGVALSGQNVSAWQAQIAHVPQSIYLADTSIAANIAFGQTSEAIDLARVKDAAKRARIGEFIETLPEAYETRCGERGVRMSVGQRQRIGIARALYKGASVLILDEATSALDNETEASVMGELTRSNSGLTLLMIAHRLTTLADCDQVVRLANGRVTERGTYAEVVGRGGRVSRSR